MKALVALSIAVSGAAFAQSEPAPDRATGIAMAEAALSARLKDPESARFEWPYDFRFGTYSLGRLSTQGWITCGTVNAKNSFGGYAGTTAALVVIKDGQVEVALIDYQGTSLLAKQCARMGMPL